MDRFENDYGDWRQMGSYKNVGRVEKTVMEAGLWRQMDY